MRRRRWIAPVLLAQSLACVSLLDLQHVPVVPDDASISDGAASSDTIASDVDPSTPDAHDSATSSDADAAEASTVCEAAHRFCDDFEAYDAARYDGSASTNASFSVVTDGGFQSNSALAVVTDPVADASNRCWAYLTLRLTGTHRRITFNVRIQAAGLGRYRVAELEFVEGTASPYSLELWLNGSTGKMAIGSFLSGGTYNEYPTTEPTFDDQWHEVQWEIDESPPKQSLLIDGVRTALPPTTFPLPSGAKNPSLSFGAAQVFGPSTTWRVQIDNVRVDDL